VKRVKSFIAAYKSLWNLKEVIQNQFVSFNLRWFFLPVGYWPITIMQNDVGPRPMHS